MDDACELRDVGLDASREFLRRARDDVLAAGEEPLADLGRGEHLHDFALVAPRDVHRRARREEQSLPVDRVEAG